MDTQTIQKPKHKGIYVQMPAPKQHFVMLDCKPDVVTSARNSRLIHAAVEEYFGFSLEQLKRKNRKKEVVFARQISMYLHEKTTDYTLKYIGKIYGGKDHATVIHSRNIIIDYLTTKGYSSEKTILDDFFTKYGFEL